MKNAARRTEITIDTHEITVFRFHSKQHSRSREDCRIDEENPGGDQATEMDEIHSKPIAATRDGSKWVDQNGRRT